MHPYRITLVAFTVPLVIFGAVIIALLCSDRMPAPRVSDSFAFNEKALWLRKTLKYDQNVDVLVVGSSMGLNNVDGSVLAEIMATKKVVNISSWGMNVGRSWHLTREVLDRIHPKVVILAIYRGDFRNGSMEEPDWACFNQLLSSWSEIPLYLENPEGNYYREHYGGQSSVKARHRQINESLAFDSFGSVPLNPEHFDYVPSRWDMFKAEDPAAGPWPDSMAALKEMATVLNERKIAFVVVVCPMRQNAEEGLSAITQRLFWDRIQPMIEDSKGMFVHISGGPDFDDSLFVDSYHLNANGAKKMTSLLAPTLKAISLQR